MRPDLLIVARKQHGWSRPKVAQALGVSLSTVRRWEHGQTVPYPYYREQLCRLYGKTAEELGLSLDTDEYQMLDEASPPAAECAQELDLLLDADEDDELDEPSEALSSLAQLNAAQASAQERADSLLEHDDLLTQGKRQTRSLERDGQAYKRDILLPGGHLFWFRVSWGGRLGHIGPESSKRFSGRSLLIGSLILLCVLCVVTITVHAGSIRTTTTTIIDDSAMGTGSNQFNYAGSGWHLNSSTQFGTCQGIPCEYNGTNSWDNTPNDYVTLSFNGIQIKFYGVLDPGHGIGAVSIDGSNETMIDFYRAARAGNQLMWTSPILPESTHTFKLRVTGQKNPSSTDAFVAADRVDIIS